MANTQLRRTNGTPTNAYKGTFSAWIKRGSLSNQRTFMNMVDGNNYCWLAFNASHQLEVVGLVSGSTYCDYKTNRLFRDTNAYYHIMVVIDTTEGTATNRMKLYVNGVQETSFATHTFNGGQSSNHPLLIASTTNYHTVGASEANTLNFDGLMSHVHFCDGTALAPTVFGSTDSTTGEWKINTSPSFTLGNNGYSILKDGNTITDQSANSNDFTVGSGTLTKTEDNPSNVFCTLNPLMQNMSGYFSGNVTSLVFGNGNTYAGKVTHGTYFGTIGVSSGKYYWEVKLEDTNNAFGIMAMKPNGGVSLAYDDATSQLYYPYSDYYYINGSNGSSGSGDFDNTINKIYSFALDATNNKMWIGRDGTFVGDPANGTGATWSSLPTGHDWTPVCHPMATTQNNNTWFNFGNGYFGTTAVSSAGTNASGNGIFEYDVPTGFTALSTKGLNL